MPSLPWRCVDLTISCSPDGSIRTTLDGVVGGPVHVDPVALARAVELLALPTLDSGDSLAERLIVYSDVVDGVQHELGDALLADPAVRARFDELLSAAPDDGLRILVRTTDDLAAAQPWEYARIDGHRPLALLDDVSFVRRVDATGQERLGSTGTNLGVLLVTSPAPPGLPPIDVDATVSTIRRSLDPLGNAVAVEHLDDPTPRRLLERLTLGGFEWLVFLGHGEPSGPDAPEPAIVLRDGGHAARIGAAALAAALIDVDLCLLLCCHSGQAAPGHEAMTAQLARCGVGYAIGMNGPIEQALAGQFAAGFLGRLAAGDGIDAAMQLGRAFIQLHATLPHWGHPVVHSGADVRLRVPAPVDMSGAAWNDVVSLVAGDVTSSIVIGTTDDAPVRARLGEINRSLVVVATGRGPVDAELGAITDSVIVGSGSEESIARLMHRLGVVPGPTRPIGRPDPESESD